MVLVATNPAPWVHLSRALLEHKTYLILWMLGTRRKLPISRFEVNHYPPLTTPRLIVLETFGLFIESAQCKHIFFAGCHDTGYLSLLTPRIKSASGRITLIRGPGFHQDFANLGFDTLDLPTVFRSSPLMDAGYASSNKDQTKPPVAPKALNSRTDPSKPIMPAKRFCVFYQKVMPAIS
jgi:hypothetical protein